MIALRLNPKKYRDFLRQSGYLVDFQLLDFNDKRGLLYIISGENFAPTFDNSEEYLTSCVVQAITCSEAETLGTSFNPIAEEEKMETSTQEEEKQDGDID